MNFIQKDICHLICTQTLFKIIVQLNYHISIDKMNYSVPYEYVGKKVEAKISKQNIVIYYKGTCIASHRRLYGRKNQYSTNDSHMPKNHQYFSWTLTGLSIGENQLGPIPKLLSRNTFISTELKNNLIKAACLSLSSQINTQPRD